ncbi:RagB/SusD family nutrient uptake outer membrane protein [Mucilaginibacter angelicae]|uniref:RagB/SusD family nutrient uptake outer membrane protein n=1 Tax=Mucilaginibacter angelicae TaxID=869718 RepID=A0ABV6L0P7_9SPHI
MKNISKYTALMAAMSISLLTACKKDYLNTTPTNLISNESIFADSALTEAYVVGRYIGVTLTSENTGPSFQRGFDSPFMSSATDESIHTQDAGSNLLQQGIQTPDNESWMGNFWIRGYRSIREVNYALANIDAVPMSTYTKNRLKAELHFIRAYRYHDLLRTYGDVPLVGDKVWGLDDRNFDPLYVRSPVQDVIKYAVSELDLAIQGLKGINLAEGRASMPAAMALKARLLLYSASPLYTGGANDPTKWTAASAAAKAVMDLNSFSLYSNYRNEFLINKTSEDIYERVYSSTGGHSALELTNGPNGYNGWGGNTPLQNFIDAFETKDGKTITDPSSGYNPQDPYTNRDPRLAATVLYNGHPYRGRNVETFVPGGLDSKDGIGAWNTTHSGYYLLKYMDESLNAGDQNNLYKDQTQTQPFKYIRYAEVLLNFAEAQNEAVGPDNSVYSALNQIRARVGMPPVTPGLSQSAMRDKIRNERQVELCFEDHRFYDVRRWKIANVTENVPAYGILPTKNANGTITYTKFIALTNRHFEDKNYWMPIPQSEILASGGKLKQNPGY